MGLANLELKLTLEGKVCCTEWLEQDGGGTNIWESKHLNATCLLVLNTNGFLK